MFKKTLIAAGAFAVTLVAFQPTADAGRVGVHIGFGNGPWSGGHHANRHYDPYYEPYYAPAHSRSYVMPRHRLFRKLSNRGYYGFRGTYRRGAVYKLRAVRNGRLFKLTVDGRTGRILRKRRIG